jgi:hypothetical protein
MQVQIRTQLLKNVATAWPVLDFSDVKRTWPAWLRVMVALIGRYHLTSANTGAVYYRAARQLSLGDPGPTDLVKLAASPADDWIARSLGYSALNTYREQVVDLGRPVAYAEQSALTQVLGSSSRIALDGGRTTILDTIQGDPEAVGWYRVTDGDPCAFCALLASRGVVYQSEETASFQAHNGCGCTVAAAFTRKQELPVINNQAQDIYYAATRNIKGARTQANVLPAFRRAWAARPTSAV